jgi:hypothetical protein
VEGGGNTDDAEIEVEFSDLPALANFPGSGDDDDHEYADLPDLIDIDSISTTLMWLRPSNYMYNLSPSFHWIELIERRQEVTAYLEQSAHFARMLIQMMPIQVEIHGPQGIRQVFSGFFRLQVNPSEEEENQYFGSGGS